jgi:hypothetical protein
VYASFQFFKHSTKTFLPLKSTKFRIVDQGLYWLFTIFITVKILLCLQDKKKKKDELLTRVFQVFLIFMYSKIMFLALEKVKKKKSFAFGGILVFSHRYFM